VIGFLSSQSPDGYAEPLRAFRQGLKESGFSDGENVAIEFRWTENQPDALRSQATALVRRNVTVIAAMDSPTAVAAKAATGTIPIVFNSGEDPVRLGLVASLAKPGGNVTGSTFLVNSLGAKRIDLLRELTPGSGVVGVLMNPKNPSAAGELKDLQTAAQALGRKLHVQNASSENEIDFAFAAFARERVGALTFAADAVFNSRRNQIIALAARYKLPTMYFLRDFADDGGLMSYGGSPDDAYRLAGAYAGRILKGEKPANLPVQQSTKVEFVINLKTAKASGIAIPPVLLARADEVIG